MNQRLWSSKEATSSRSKKSTIFSLSSLQWRGQETSCSFFRSSWLLEKKPKVSEEERGVSKKRSHQECEVDGDEDIVEDLILSSDNEYEEEKLNIDSASEDEEDATNTSSSKQLDKNQKLYESSKQNSTKESSANSSKRRRSKKKNGRKLARRKKAKLGSK